VFSGSKLPHSRVKKKWLRILTRGTGTLVIAVTVLSSVSPEAATLDAEQSVSQRVEQARKWFREYSAQRDSAPQPDEFAWMRWGNLNNPRWNNWPNWHNWPNWPNWPNWGRRPRRF
jgi:hypothetical protein